MKELESDKINKTLIRYSVIQLLETGTLSLLLILLILFFLFILLNNTGVDMNSLISLLGSVASIVSCLVAIVAICMAKKWWKDFDNKVIRENVFEALAIIDNLEVLIEKQIENRIYYCNTSRNAKSARLIPKKKHEEANYLKELYKNEVSFLRGEVLESIKVLTKISYKLKNLKVSVAEDIEDLKYGIDAINHLALEEDGNTVVTPSLIVAEKKKYIKNDSNNIFKTAKVKLKSHIKN
ncbi:hypothetical protein [Pseudoalteromonas atlantica]|uniref:hypothetical protein n=1 Tax=Pseudoalteromonas atlantica TaxID=288 RepID=UPI0037363E0B